MTLSKEWLVVWTSVFSTLLSRSDGFQPLSPTTTTSRSLTTPPRFLDSSNAFLSDPRRRVDGGGSSASPQRTSSTRLFFFERMTEECVAAVITAQELASTLKLTAIGDEVMMAGCIDHPDDEPLRKTLRNYKITSKLAHATLKQMYNPTPSNGVTKSKSGLIDSHAAFRTPGPAPGQIKPMSSNSRSSASAKSVNPYTSNNDWGDDLQEFGGGFTVHHSNNNNNNNNNGRMAGVSLKGYSSSNMPSSSFSSPAQPSNNGDWLNHVSVDDMGGGRNAYGGSEGWQQHNPNNHWAMGASSGFSSTGHQAPTSHAHRRLLKQPQQPPQQQAAVAPEEQPFSRALRQTFNRAEELAEEMGSDTIRSHHLFLALLDKDDDDFYGDDSLAEEQFYDYLGRVTTPGYSGGWALLKEMKTIDDSVQIVDVSNFLFGLLADEAKKKRRKVGKSTATKKKAAPAPAPPQAQVPPPVAATDDDEQPRHQEILPEPAAPQAKATPPQQQGTVTPPPPAAATPKSQPAGPANFVLEPINGNMGNAQQLPDFTSAKKSAARRKAITPNMGESFSKKDWREFIVPAVEDQADSDLPPGFQDVDYEDNEIDEEEDEEELLRLVQEAHALEQQQQQQQQQPPPQQNYVPEPHVEHHQPPPPQQNYYPENSSYLNLEPEVEEKEEEIPDGPTATLDELGTDLTKQAAEGLLDPVFGRDEEILSCMRTLIRRRKNNVCLIGEPGVGKTAIAEGVAQMLVDEQKCPPRLRGHRLMSLELASLVAGTKFRGEFEQRLQTIIKEVTDPDSIPTIVFIDEIHNLVGAGGAEGGVDASNMLKPVMAKGGFQIIGATTISEYRQHIEKDAALERRLQPVVVKEPTVDQAVKILTAVRRKYEKHHGVRYTDEALETAASMSDRYINDRFLPDKALDILDEAGAVAHLGHSGSDVPVVDEHTIAKVVSDWSGVPLGKLEGAEMDRLQSLEDDIGKRVKGQGRAIRGVARAVRRARAGLRDPKRPVASFMFCGPTGTGKTELCKALAETYFGSEKAMIRVDMSEFMEKHSASRLTGPPPGYVGYEEGGQLTEAVRRSPHSVVLLDEVEKAHGDVLNVLLQIMEDGMLTDGSGRVVNFKNSIIVMTSNVGSARIGEVFKVAAEANPVSKPGIFNFMGGQKDKKAGEKLDEHHLYPILTKVVKEELESTMKPELLNRIDEIVVFSPLAVEELSMIAKLLVDKTVKRALEEQDIKLKVDKTVFDRILKDGLANAEQFGARPMRRAAQRYVEDSLSEALVQGFCTRGEKVTISLKASRKLGVKYVLFVKRHRDGKTLQVTVEDGEGGMGNSPVVIEEPAENDAENTAEHNASNQSDEKPEDSLPTGKEKAPKKAKHIQTSKSDVAVTSPPIIDVVHVEMDDDKEDPDSESDRVREKTIAAWSSPPSSAKSADHSTRPRKSAYMDSLMHSPKNGNNTTATGSDSHSETP